MPRKSDRKLFLEAYERELIDVLQELEKDLELELDLMLVDSVSDSDSSSISSLSSASSSSSSSSSSSDSDPDSDSDLNSDASELLDIFDELLPTVVTNRYLYPRLCKPKSRHFVSHILPQLSDDEFKEDYRMFRSSFSAILAKIQNYPVFHTSDETGTPLFPITYK